MNVVPVMHVGDCCFRRTYTVLRSVVMHGSSLALESAASLVFGM